MEELIQILERQIKALIQQYDQAKSANDKLHQSKFAAIREKELLLAKQQKAITQIETLVSKLKEIEKLP